MGSRCPDLSLVELWRQFVSALCRDYKRNEATLFTVYSFEIKGVEER